MNINYLKICSFYLLESYSCTLCVCLKTFLAGKYSQGFVDALASAITDAVEREFDITGLAESGVVLEIRFMPGTFMEHVVENSTYRRILIKARGCAPRDLWIKWTRLDGRGTYTISDYAATDEIIFEIADEVPGKIREKEYRYLAAESVEKYQTAMSRKNMTARCWWWITAAFPCR